VRTTSIETFLEDEPLEVVKGCSALLMAVSNEYVENIYSDLGLKVLSSVMIDAVTRLEDELNEKRN